MHPYTNEPPSGFDLESALTVTGGDPHLVKELADLFLREYPEFIRNLERAVSRVDPQAIEISAHQLKGALTNFGGRSAAEAASILENKGRTGDLDGAGEALFHLQRELAPFLAELRSFQP